MRPGEGVATDLHNGSPHVRWSPCQMVPLSYVNVHDGAAACLTFQRPHIPQIIERMPGRGMLTQSNERQDVCEGALGPAVPPAAAADRHQAARYNERPNAHVHKTWQKGKGI